MKKIFNLLILYISAFNSYLFCMNDEKTYYIEESKVSVTKDENTGLQLYAGKWLYNPEKIKSYKGSLKKLYKKDARIYLIIVNLSDFILIKQRDVQDFNRKNITLIISNYPDVVLPKDKDDPPASVNSDLNFDCLIAAKLFFDEIYQKSKKSCRCIIL